MPGGALPPLKHNRKDERQQRRRERRQQDFKKILSTIEHGYANIRISTEVRESRQTCFSTTKRENDGDRVDVQLVVPACCLSKNNEARVKQCEAHISCQPNQPREARVKQREARVFSLSKQ